MKSLYYLILAIILVMVIPHQAKSQNTAKTDTVYIKSLLHCESCKTAVSEVVRFEKGVKQFDVDLASSTILIAYNPEKTNNEKLAAAIVKSGKKAELISKADFLAKRAK